MCKKKKFKNVHKDHNEPLHSETGSEFQNFYLFSSAFFSHSKCPNILNSKNHFDIFKILFFFHLLVARRKKIF